MGSRGPLKYREVISRLQQWGVVELPGGRGKGSERILLLPAEPGSRRGPQFPIKHHGDGTEISLPVIQALLRRFSIEPKAFWHEG